MDVPNNKTTTIDSAMDVTLKEEFLGLTNRTLKNNTKSTLVLCIVFPFLLVFLWLCLPFTKGENSFYMFVFIWYPVFSLIYCYVLWILLQVYLPLPTKKIQFMVAVSSMTVISIGQLILFLTVRGTVVLRGPVVVANLVNMCAIFGICYHFILKIEAAEVQITLDELKKNEGDSLLDSRESTSMLRQILQLLKKFFLSLISTNPSHPLFPPADLTNIKGEFLSIIIPISLLYLFEVWVVVFQIVIWESVVEDVAELILVITFSLLGTCIRSIIAFSIERIEKEPNFELPKNILLSFLTEAIITAFYRYLLWKTTGIVFFIFILVVICEDFHRGLFNLISHKLPNIRIFAFMRTENSQEAHEIALIHYILRKQLQIVITSSCYIYWILIHFYWNNEFFEEIVLNQERFDAICYLVPITLLVDFLSAFLTYNIAKRFYQYDILSILQRYYSYPKVRSFSILVTMMVMMLMFITSFEVKVISSG